MLPDEVLIKIHHCVVGENSSLTANLTQQFEFNNPRNILNMVGFSILFLMGTIRCELLMYEKHLSGKSGMRNKGEQAAFSATHGSPLPVLYRPSVRV